MYYDSTWLLMIPGLLLGLWAQYKVKHAYAQYSKIGTTRGVDAQTIARQMLSASGNGQVLVNGVSGQMTDHFDPRNNTVSLSEGVWGSPSIAAVGIAAHECGHAMQAGSGYGPFKLRSAVVPVVSIGSRLYFPIFLVGMMASWDPLITAGIICFSLTLLFSLITLPVEFDASRRAIVALSEGGYMTADELKGARAVLNAAALTYVAAAISSLLQLLRLVLMSRSRSRRR